MSNAVDNRIVQLEMDNGSFERNANQSIRTLDKLDNALNFKNGGRSFAEVEAAAAKCNFKPLLGAADTVVAKFSAMEIAGITAIQNITNRVVNMGIQMAKSLSIDQVSTGFSKYEQKTSNVQTLIYSTGKSIDEVNKYLDRLMWFSDETSYGFTDMTQALATMVSAGGDIEKVTPMIEGIANSVAFAGKGAAEFYRVMYNLNQSYSQGFLSLMDWKSVQGASANSKQLVETLIRAGEEAGTIKKGEVTIDNFTNTLSKKWANREVMENAFGYFDEMTQKAYEMIGTMDEEGNVIETATQAYDILSKKYDTVSLKAAMAGQQAKSLSEAIGATKDAVSSGWMRAFEIIIGDYDQAVELWSGVAEGLWSIFAGGFQARNDKLKEVFRSSPVEKFAANVKEAGISFDEFKDKVKESYLEMNKDKSEEDFAKMTEGVETVSGLLKQSWVNSSLLEKTLGKFPKIMGETSKKTNTVKADIRDLIKDVNSGKYGYGLEEQQRRLAEAGIDGSSLGGNWLQQWYNALSVGNEEAINSINETIGGISEVTDGVAETNDGIEKQKDLWKELSDQAKEFDNEYYNAETGRTIMLDGFKNIIGAIGDRLGVIKESWNKAFPAITAERIREILVSFNFLTTKLKMSADEGKILGNVFDKIFGILSKVKSAIAIFGNLSISIAKLGGRFASWFVNLESVKKVLESVKEFLGQSYDGATKGIDSFIDKIELFKETIDNIGEKDFDKIFAPIKNFSSKFEGASEHIKKYAETVKSTILNVFSNIGSGFSNGNGTKILAGGAFIGTIALIISKIKSIVEDSGIKGIAEKIKGLLDPVGAAFDAFTKKMNSSTLRNIAVSIGVLAASLFVLSSIDGDKLISGLVGIAGAATILYFVVKKLAGLSMLTDGIKGAKAFGSIGRTISSISSSLMMLSISMKILSTINFGQALIALGSLYAMTVIMGKMAKSLVWVETKGMGSLLGIAASLVIFAVAVKILSKLSVGGAIKGLASIGVLMAELQWFLNKTSDIKAGSMLAMAVSLIAISGAFVILSAAITILGLLSVGSLIKGIVSIGAVLAMFAIFANKIDAIDIGSLLAATASIVLIAGALVIIAGALAIFSLVQDKSGAVIGMATSLVAISLALGLLSKYGGGAGNLLAAAASILVISIALGALAGALALFGAIGNSMDALLTMLGALVIVIGGLGLAATFMAPIIPAMAALGGVLLMVSAAVFLTGAGLILLAAGIVAFSASILANIGTVIAALLTLVGGLGSVLFALGSVIISVIGQLIPSMVDAGLQLINALISGFSSNVGGIVEGIALLLVNLITALVSSLDTIIQAGIDLAVALVNGIADGIRDNADVILDALGNLLSSIIELVMDVLGRLLGKIPGVGPKIQEALESAKESVRDFFNVDDGGKKEVDVPVDVTVEPDVVNEDEVSAVVEDAVDNVDASGASVDISDAEVTGGDEIATKASQEISTALNNPGNGDADNGPSIGVNILDLLVGGIDGQSDMVGASLTNVLKTAANNVDFPEITGILSTGIFSNLGNSLFGNGENGENGENGNNAITETITKFSESLSTAANFGASGAAGANEFADNFSNTMESGDNKSKAKNAGTALANSGNSGLKAVSTIASGEFFGQGFANGIRNKIPEVSAAAAELAEAASSALNIGLDINSPSRVAMKSGSYFTEGFVIGIDMKAMYAAASAYKMGSDSIDALNAGIQNGKISRVMPVLDTSDLYNQMDEFDGIYRPVIKPTLDMSNVDPAYRNMTAVATARYSGYDGESDSHGDAVSGGSVVNYTQNNYSPKALSSVEIYRQTKNQLNSLEKRFAKK